MINKLAVLRSWLYSVLIWIIGIGITPEVVLWQYTWQLPWQKRAGLYNKATLTLQGVEFLILMAFIALLICYVNTWRKLEELIKTTPEK